MYNFDGYFLLVSSSTMTYTQLPTVGIYTVYYVPYLLFLIVPPQIVYESLSSDEGDAAVKYG